jgi:hypothetical protein
MDGNHKDIECSWFPTDLPCDTPISGNEEEVFNIAVQYAVESHGFRDTPGLREQLRSMLRDEGQTKEKRERVSNRAVSR